MRSSRAAACVALVLLSIVVATATHAGIITTIAGTPLQGGFSGDGGPALAATLYLPTGIAVASDGTIYFADNSNFRIRKIDPAGIISTIVGDGTIGDGGDGGPGTAAEIAGVAHVSLSPDDTKLYFADLDNNRVRVVDLTTGIVNAFAGSGFPGGFGFAGDGGPALTAKFKFPDGTAVDRNGNVYIADDFNGRIRMVDTNGIINTFASFNHPADVAVGYLGDLYVFDITLQDPNTGESKALVHRIDHITHAITLVAGGGDGAPGSGLATETNIGSGMGDMLLDPYGDLFIASSAERVFRVDPATGLLSVYAGVDTRGFSGDGGPATSAQLDMPFGLAVTPTGHLLVVDYHNMCIRSIEDPDLLLREPTFTIAATAGANGAITPSGTVSVVAYDTVTFTITPDPCSDIADVRIDGVSVGAVTSYMFASVVADHTIEATFVRQHPTPAIPSITDVTSDQGRRVRIHIARSEHDIAGDATPIRQYEAYRRIDPLPGDAAVVSRSARAVPPAVAAADRIARARAAGMISDPGILFAGWDYVGATAAHIAAEYDLVVPTLEDSGAVNPLPGAYSSFFIRAATAAPLTFYDSCPDSGYSLDNLPPAKPSHLHADYADGATHLRWGSNTEPDLWYYRLYRGSGSGFVPGLASWIANVGDVSYVDPGPAGGYYKLSALDVNGNESGYALITPVVTTDVLEEGALAFGLDAVRPNPSTGEALTVHFTLPGAEPARLELMDLMGRRAASRDVGALGPGRHTLDLSAGRRLKPGVYVVRLTQGGSSRAVRVAVLK
jgi:hypothetical protein